MSIPAIPAEAPNAERVRYEIQTLAAHNYQYHARLEPESMSFMLAVNLWREIGRAHV